MAFKRGNEVTRWLTIEKIATKLYRGFGIKKDQAIEGVGYPCVRYGWIHISNLIYFDKCQFGIDETLIKNKRYASKGDILFAIISENTNDIEKAIAYIGEKDILVGDGVVVMKHNQNPKYLAYALSTTNAQKQKSQGKIKLRVVNSGVPHIKKLTLPIPSLAKQEEIVNLLDKFWKLSKELEKELEKELNLRKQQYEYYRDELLSFKQDNKIEWLALKDICNLQ
ncbi:restriction endonuclease subunit S, partial [Candidatus Mycoplasma haematobovis]|uniref:restriction endonuclease subunit S n=1 Tax=Candidatus Mycoplasma haematobovis TaxID=432608 RepID=UPI000ACB06DB